ncbi:MAG TPA: HAMP domain-containing protein, partial [Candidatus Angelobacter sp.]|nr:HAMP domain-containing protein [Candidatus Angelobacter sp.]
MKGRLNSTLWMMVSVNAVAFLAVLWTAYHAGSMSNGVGIADAPSVSGSAGVYLVVALVLAVSAVALTIFLLANRVLDPVKRLSEFAERFAQGDYRTRAAVDSADDFGFIAENLNRAAETSSRAMYNQEAQENLQKSVTEFLTIVSQIA